jgi:hypothetical protein
MAPDPHAHARIYTALGGALAEGRYPPGMRIDIHRVADRNRSSATPVREVLSRLLGEGLVEISSRGGYRVARLDRRRLEHIYRWNSLILIGATHLFEGAGSPESYRPLPGKPDFFVTEGGAAVAALFLTLSRLTANEEIQRAVAVANTRLAFVRETESTVLRKTPMEIAALIETAADGDIPILRRRILSYHQRRIRRANDIVAALPRWQE